MTVAGGGIEFFKRRKGKQQDSLAPDPFSKLPFSSNSSLEVGIKTRPEA